MLLLALLAVPVVFGVTVFFLGKNRITVFELLIQLAVACALMVGGYYLTRWAGLQDEEVWSGRVVSKPSGSSSCCHSYRCRCRQECTGSGSKRTCSEKCDTCYEHASDWYHEAWSSNGERIYRSACDRSSPESWSRIRIGEATAVAHRYTNYIKADPRDFVPPAAGTVTAPIPAYPAADGWHARRFLFVGTILPPNAGLIDLALDELNADIGAPKQVNAIVVVANDPSPAYFDALRVAWLGGKKNDVVLVIGTPAFPAIAWARVMAWNKATGGEDEFKGGLAARIEALGTFDGTAVLAVLREEIEARYVRRSFSELEYLIARAQPPGWAVILLFILGLGVSAVLHWAFWRNRRQLSGAAPHVVVGRLARRLRARLQGHELPAEDGASGPPASPTPRIKSRQRRQRDDDAS